MKTTIEVPDELFRQTKATAALRGESLKEFVTAALRAQLERQAPGGSTRSGWRSVYGEADREEVEEIDALVAEEFGRVEPEEWP